MGPFPATWQVIHGNMNITNELRDILTNKQKNALKMRYF